MIMKVQRNNSDNARNDFTAGIKVHFSIRFIQLLNGILQDRAIYRVYFHKLLRRNFLVFHPFLSFHFRSILNFILY